nr:MAG TPA: hypothetical protein [Caudoviricetes sp.]
MSLFVIEYGEKTHQVHKSVGDDLRRGDQLLLKIRIFSEAMQLFEVTDSGSVFVGRGVFSAEPIKNFVLKVFVVVKTFDVGHEMLLSSEYISL